MWKMVNRLFEAASAYVTVWPMLGLTGMTTMIFGWAAFATDPLQPYAPLSWVLAGLIGAFLSLVMLWLACKARDLWITATINKAFLAARSDTINPLERVFQRQRINISDLLNPYDRIVKSKSFIDCDIIGPANIAVDFTSGGGGMIVGCHFYYCAGVIMKDEVVVPLGIMFRDCTFQNCRLYALILLVPSVSYDVMRSSLPGLSWITPEPSSSL